MTSTKYYLRDIAAFNAQQNEPGINLGHFNFFLSHRFGLFLLSARHPGMTFAAGETLLWRKRTQPCNQLTLLIDMEHFP
jgi:hypothetical protein